MIPEKTNQDIKYPQVRVINEDGKQLGIMSSNEARKLAHNLGLDLVEISNKSNPPVVKILDYSKFKYDKSKREKELAKKNKEHTVETKELWFRPGTDDHDIEIKLRKAKKFLEKGNRVKFTMKFKGREQNSMEKFKDVLISFAERLESNILQSPSQNGRNLTILVGPIK